MELYQSCFNAFHPFLGGIDDGGNGGFICRKLWKMCGPNKAFFNIKTVSCETLVIR